MFGVLACDGACWPAFAVSEALVDDGLVFAVDLFIEEVDADDLL